MDGPYGSASGERTCQFLVEAGLSVGMGHLRRSSAVAKMIEGRGIRPLFLLRGDAVAEDLARRLNLPMGNGEPGGPIVMDLVKVGPQDGELIMSCSPRVLFSPVCDRPDLASHVLVRSASAEIRSKLSEGVDIRERSEYAYATAAGLELRDRNFDALRVGVCLSGGQDPDVLDEVVELVASLPKVQEVRVIRRKAGASEPTVDKDQTKVRQTGFTLTPWRFLDDVNVFIGGNGVMLSEAIAQGIPTISISRPGQEGKNRHMEIGGALQTYGADASSLAAVASLLMDTAALESMYEAARRQAPPGTAAALADDLYRILAT